MKHFRIVQKLFGLVGIEPDEFQLAFNKKYLMFNLVSGLTLISVSIYMLYDDESVGEYIDSFYLLIISFFIFVSYTITVFNKRELFNFFDGFETFFDDGKQSEFRNSRGIFILLKNESFY